MATATDNKTLYTHLFPMGSYSSNIDGAAWDEKTESLYILFKNGNKAGYRDFPLTKVNDFLSASSPGRFYNTNIRGKFNGLHVEDVLALRDAEPQTNVDDEPVKAEYGFVYTYTVDVEVTRVEAVEVEAKNVKDALAQAEKVGRPVKISWEL